MTLSLKKNRVRQRTIPFDYIQQRLITYDNVVRRELKHTTDEFLEAFVEVMILVVVLFSVLPAVRFSSFLFFRDSLITYDNRVR